MRKCGNSPSREQRSAEAQWLPVHLRVDRRADPCQAFSAVDQVLDRLNPTFCDLYASEGRPLVAPDQLLLVVAEQVVAEQDARINQGLPHQRLSVPRAASLWPSSPGDAAHALHCQAERCRGRAVPADLLGDQWTGLTLLPALADQLAPVLTCFRI